MCGRCWRWWRQQGDRAAEFVSHGSRTRSADLAERVRAVIEENPQSGHLFVFRSRRGDRLKILVWDRDGFVLWYKRLEAGMCKLPGGTGNAIGGVACQ